MAAEARKKKKKLKMRILQDAETSTPFVSVPQIFTEKKKNQQMVPISEREYAKFTQKPISVYSKTNKWYQSQKPTKFTQCVNSKYAESEN